MREFKSVFFFIKISIQTMNIKKIVINSNGKSVDKPPLKSYTTEIGIEAINRKYKNRGTNEKIRLIKIPNGRKIRILFSKKSPRNRITIPKILRSIIDFIFGIFS